MAMEAHHSLREGQPLLMASPLQQAIQQLQLSILELREVVQKELLGHLFLEAAAPRRTSPELSPYPRSTRANAARARIGRALAHERAPGPAWPTTPLSALSALPGVASSLIPLPASLAVGLDSPCTRFSELPYVLRLLRGTARDLPALRTTRSRLLAGSFALRPCPAQ